MKTSTLSAVRNAVSLLEAIKNTSTEPGSRERARDALAPLRNALADDITEPAGHEETLAALSALMEYVPRFFASAPSDAGRTKALTMARAVMAKSFVR